MIIKERGYVEEATPPSHVLTGAYRLREKSFWRRWIVVQVEVKRDDDTYYWRKSKAMDLHDPAMGSLVMMQYRRQGQRPVEARAA